MTDPQIKKLIDLLDQIESNSEIVKIVPDEIRDKEDIYCQDDLHPLIKEVIALADLVLITPEGMCDWMNMKLVQEKYKIKPGETDSYKWLTGIIITSKGEIVYG